MRQFHSSFLVFATILFASLAIFPMSAKAIDQASPTNPTIMSQTVSPIATPTAEQTNLCLIFEKVDANVAADADKKITEIQKKRAQQDLAKNLARASLDEKITTIRKNWPELSAQYFSKIDARAITVDQKNAVNKFKVVLNDALAKRQTEIDKVRKDFRQNVDKVIAQRDENVKTALPILKESVKNVALEAKTKCAEPLPNLQIITSTLKGQLITFQSTFKNSVQGTEPIEIALDKLAQERQESIKKIDNNFKATEEAARFKLRSVLGEGF